MSDDRNQALRDALNKLERVALCDDEGCPHHGTRHVCVARAEAERREAEREGRLQERAIRNGRSQP